MKLIDAELQQTTGFPIAKGRLWVGSEAEAAALGIGAHRHLLLSSYWYGTIIRPAISITRDPFGFCDATTSDVGLVFYSLSLKDIVSLAGIKTLPFRRVDLSRRRRSVMCAGARAGDLIAHEWRGDRRIYRSSGPIQRYELSAEYVSDGLHVVISGQVAHGESEHGQEFSVDATLPWETLALKGFGGPGQAFGHPPASPSKLDPPNRPRDPRKLDDLLVPDQPLGWPYLKGQILFTPELATSLIHPAHEFVSIRLDGDSIPFMDAPGLEVLDSGFARARGRDRSLTITLLGRESLERALRKRDSFSMQLTGDALGQVGYETGYPHDVGDPLGRIYQQMRTMSLHVALSKNGLEISVSGELDVFDPVEFAEHREKRGSQLQPLRAYALQTTIPWALLTVMGVSFADRATNF